MVAIEAGDEHGLALRSDGTVVAWGDNEDGQSNVPANLSNVVAIAGGRVHSLALRADGTVVAWGSNAFGEASVPSGVSNIVAIAAGYHCSFALRADGTLAAWGSNYEGQRDVPVGLSNVVAVSVGESPILALRANGTVVAWGGNTWGQTNVPAGLTNAVAVAGGGGHGLALVGGGKPFLNPLLGDRMVLAGIDTVVFNAPASGGWPLCYMWQLNGNNLPGATNACLVLSNVVPAQAGRYSLIVSNAWGTATNLGAQLTVVPAIVLQHPRSQVVFEGATVLLEVQVRGSEPLSYQWRFNGADLAGETNATLVLDYFNRAQEGDYAVIVSNRFGSVMSGVARMTISDVAAWGRDYDKQASVPAGVSNVVAIACGWSNSLALRADGTVVAWGSNDSGQTNVPTGLSNVVAIAGGVSHNLSVRSDGTVVAWGSNDSGETLVPAGLSNVVAIAGGAAHSVAVRADGTVVAWGRNTWGETSVPAELSNAVAVAGGWGHSLALRADGTVIAWGSNDSGQTNLPAGLSNVVAVACGAFHNLALVGDNEMLAPWRLRDPHISTNGFTMGVPTLRGRTYIMEQNDSLDEGHWTVVRRLAGNGTVCEFTAPVSPSPHLYFRARRIP